MMIQPSWSNYSYFDSILDQDDLTMDFCTSEEQHNFSSPITVKGFDDVCKWLCDDDQHMELIPSDSYEWSPNISMNSNDASMVQNDDVIEMGPRNGMENLLTAYSEAIGLGQNELAKVIQNCVCQKASPVGPTIERLALNLFKCGENQEEDYLKQRRNFKTAFRAFYEIFPYGRFAHFTANSAITESVPSHVESVHIVDFDLCEGSQWPAVIEAVARMKKSLIITSIKPDQEQDQFEQTKRNLFYFSRNLGMSLKIQEINMDQIVNKLEGRQFLVFNCMVNLPHIGRSRKSTQVIDFLNIAKVVLAKTEGIITFGDGDQESEKMRKSSNFSSFFNQNLTHYKALYESMEFGFPSYLNEARIAMEALFLAPFISSKSWFQKWEEQREYPFSQMGFGRKMSKESWNEARELVKEGESLYGIRIEGGNGNQMVLEWNGIPLVKVSVWM